MSPAALLSAVARQLRMHARQKAWSQLSSSPNLRPRVPSTRSKQIAHSTSALHTYYISCPECNVRN